jgi:hypothetical protein
VTDWENKDDPELPAGCAWTWIRRVAVLAVVVLAAALVLHFVIFAS